MSEITIISIIAAVTLGALLWDRHKDKRRFAEELKGQRETNQELLKRIPVMGGSGSTKEILTVEKIADAVRMEGFFPEIDGNLVIFRVQGKTYYIDGNRLPLVLLVKPFGISPGELEMDIFKEAAHKMSDRLVMVKATVSEDGKNMRYFVAVRDRNYESFRANLTAYMGFLENGQHLLNEVYDKLVCEKRKEALDARPIVPKAKQGGKIMS